MGKLCICIPNNEKASVSIASLETQEVQTAETFWLKIMAQCSWIIRLGSCGDVFRHITRLDHNSGLLRKPDRATQLPTAGVYSRRYIHCREAKHSKAKIRRGTGNGLERDPHYG